MTDSLGNEYRVGDILLYVAGGDQARPQIAMFVEAYMNADGDPKNRFLFANRRTWNRDQNNVSVRTIGRPWRARLKRLSDVLPHDKALEARDFFEYALELKGYELGLPLL